MHGIPVKRKRQIWKQIKHGKVFLYLDEIYKLHAMKEAQIEKDIIRGRITKEEAYTEKQKFIDRIMRHARRYPQAVVQQALSELSEKYDMTTLLPSANEN